MSFHESHSTTYSHALHMIRKHSLPTLGINDEPMIHHSILVTIKPVGAATRANFWPRRFSSRLTASWIAS